jgi:two-component system, chemotaxis family, protein-glutamate methylesterase/glutaminase
MNRLRVLVVEDSTTIRRYLVGVLLRDAGIEVVGEATNGTEAAEMCARLRPDVVTMDMILPNMNGVLATEQIMAYTPTPILIVSSSVNRGEAFRTYDALAAGAVDVLDKPRANESTEQWELRFLAALKMVARIKVITHPRGRLRASEMGSRLQTGTLLSEETVQRTGWDRSAHSLELIAIGASTGGPAAISQILQSLPLGFPIPILIVIHIAEIFAAAFGDWLAMETQLPVRFARDYDQLPRVGGPCVLVAPAGRHMIVEDARIRLVESPERNSCRPSVDVLFESLAREMGERASLTLLTGMGRDGAQGMLTARKAGCDTVAQDEHSSVVFGMPAEAIRLGAARRVLPLQDIAGYFQLLAGRPGTVSDVDERAGRQ